MNPTSLIKKETFRSVMRPTATIPDRSEGQNYENEAQVVMKQNHPLKLTQKFDHFKFN